MYLFFTYELVQKAILRNIWFLRHYGEFVWGGCLDSLHKNGPGHFVCMKSRWRHDKWP
jgi:hypothetical protein